MVPPLHFDTIWISHQNALLSYTVLFENVCLDMHCATNMDPNQLSFSQFLPASIASKPHALKRAWEQDRQKNWQESRMGLLPLCFTSGFQSSGIESDSRVWFFAEVYASVLCIFIIFQILIEFRLTLLSVPMLFQQSVTHCVHMMLY